LQFDSSMESARPIVKWGRGRRFGSGAIVGSAQDVRC
jgi:hypothetical protein